MTSPVEENLIGSLEKGADLEVRVRRLAVDGEEFLEIREYVPSSERYGRGLLIPVALRKELQTLLRGAG